MQATNIERRTNEAWNCGTSRSEAEREEIQRGRSTSVEEEVVKAKIHVTLKQGILDPQGKAIEHALDALGFKHASNVRVGKYMEVDLAEVDRAKAEVEVKAMCEKLLANTIIEDYRYELG